MSTLKIFFPGQWRDSASPCAWALCDESDAVLKSGTGPLASLPKGHDCIAIIAPERVLIIATKLPPGSRRRWQAALPFVAEDYTLPDPEDNHVVPGPILADGRIMLAVTDKAWLKRIIDSCRSAKLPVHRMVPETLLPALTADTWTMVWDGNNGFIRTGSASGFALDSGDADTAPLALRLLLNTTQDALPEKIIVRFAQHVAHEQHNLPQWNDLPAPLAAGPAWDWRQAPVPDSTLNLLWGEFAPRAKFREWWPNLRPAVLILLAVLAVETIGTNLEWALLANEKNNLAKEMERTFRSTFGATSTLVNAPLQMQRNLTELRHGLGLPDDGDFLPLLDQAASRLAQLPAGSVRAMHYESGRLDVDIKLHSNADFRILQQHLQKKGLGVLVGDIQDSGSGAEARVTLSPGEMR